MFIPWASGLFPPGSRTDAARCTDERRRSGGRDLRRTAPAVTTTGARRPRCGRRGGTARGRPSRAARAGARRERRRGLAERRRRAAGRAAPAEAPRRARGPAQCAARRSRSAACPPGRRCLLLVGVLSWAPRSTRCATSSSSTGFNIGIIVASIVAILVVRRSGMFWVVVSPPIVYSLGAGITLYMRSGGLHDRGVLIDAATNWLVYGFPAIAAATAAVLIIAGVRLITRR